jgi:invasion protein IalB
MSQRLGFYTAGRLIVAAIASATILSSVAMAEDATPAPADKPAAKAAAPAPAAAANNQAPSPWIKVCGTDPQTKKEGCVVSQELRAETGQPIATISIQNTPDPKKYGLGLVVPLGFVLPPGIVINVDGDKKATAPFVICIPGGQKQPPACVAQAVVADDLVSALRKGTKMSLVVTSAQGKTIPIDVSLSGFAKSFDGPGVDKAAAENVREQLAKGLQERAQEARQKLIDQQQKELNTPAN